MLNAAPPIDRRSAADIAASLQQHLRQRTPEFKPTGAGLALINIFARYSEIIIERLNSAPRKNFMAFLNLIGASASRPARPCAADFSAHTRWPSPSDGS